MLQIKMFTEIVYLNTQVSHQRETKITIHFETKDKIACSLTIFYYEMINPTHATEIVHKQ